MHTHVCYAENQNKMPKISFKNFLIKSLIKTSFSTIDDIYIENEIKGILTDEHSEQQVEAQLDDLYDNLSIVLSHRRGIQFMVPKSKVWFEDVLGQMDDDRFRQMLRCTRQQFDCLHSYMCKSPVFFEGNASKQFSIRQQLAIVLFRLGSSGESASNSKIATLFGIGDGGTIIKVTDRVFRAFLELRDTFIFWPNEEERNGIVNETYNELPHCIGYVDGTEFKLAETPVENSVSFFSRKHIYSIKAQIACDHKLRIRHVTVGAPGSVHDARIYSNCPLSINPTKYFSEYQWIAGDSAYGLSNTVIVPYKSSSKAMTPIMRKQFNMRISKYRVRAEHCIGLLKERFGSLKELRHRIVHKQNKRNCCRWIIVACIIHNMLICEDDMNYFTYENVEENGSETSNVQNEAVEFEVKRQALYQLMFDS